MGGAERNAFLFSVAVACAASVQAHLAEGVSPRQPSWNGAPRCHWFPALICSTGAGRQCFHYSALEIYRSFQNSVWLLLLLPWKQTAKNGACFFKLSIPSHRFFTPFCRSCKECLQGIARQYDQRGGRAETTLAKAKFQKDIPIVSIGKKAIRKKV